MSWLRIAATVTALIALALVPAAAQAAVTGSDITGWTQANPAAPANDPYLISFDNNPTTLSVTGTAVGTGTVDVVCYFGSPGSLQDAVLESAVTVTGGKFTASNQHLQNIAGHACRLRAVPTGAEGTSDTSDFAGPDVAVSEAALPVATISGTGLNVGTPYNDYVNDVTLTGYAAWGSPGITPSTSEVGCGGPFAAPIDSDFDVGNFAVDCVGSLLSNDLGAFGGRSEVQIDGHNAYDPGSAQALFAAANGHAASQNLSGFPTNLTDHVTWDPTTGLLSSQSDESWVECNGPNEQIQTFATCPSFVNSGVELDRDITTSDGGRVVTMTDTWSSTDGKAHALDLLYDDYDGLSGVASGDRGYQFPGQTGFSEFGGGTDVPGPGSAPGSILMRTNVTAPDGSTSEAAGAITFGTAPSEFRFVSNNEFEEHNVLVVPAGGSASLSYVYSVGYSVADATQLALAAQDQFEPPSVVIGPLSSGTTVSSPSTTLSGIASAGSGIKSLVVGGQPVPMASDGTWSVQVPLNPGTNTITALATDGAGETAQQQVAVVYNAPAPSPSPSSSPPVKCRVPKTKGMKLNAAEKALRRAHCKVGKVKRANSRTVRSGHVASTAPRAGRVLKPGTKVELFVSKGR
ncbi:MAG TPA: PASTA domain-containing protein [Solirubrobacteraceae bacterium]|nr:PASTA domain-containing protein [Solirubrobacteraceae bacterium]